MDVGRVGEVEERVLTVLRNHGALLTVHVQRLAEHLANVKEGRHALDNLRGKRLVDVRTCPHDRRRRYVVLSKKGQEHVDGSISRGSGVVNYRMPYSKELKRWVTASEFVVLAVESGISLDDIVGRLQLKSLYKIPDLREVASLSLVARVNGLTYAIHTKLRRRSVMGESINKIALYVRVDGHVIFDTNRHALSACRRYFVRKCPATHLFLAHMADAPLLVAHLKAPSAWVASARAKLAHLAEDARVVATPPASPAPYCVVASPGRWHLADLRLDDVGQAAQFVGFVPSYGDHGAQGVVFCVRDRRQAMVWSRLLGHNPNLYWLLVGGKLPPVKSLLRSTRAGLQEAGALRVERGG